MSTEPQDKTKKNTQAIASLILGAISIVFALFNYAPGFLSVLGIVGAVAALLALLAGVRSLRGAREIDEQDRKLAIAGIAAGGLGLLLFIITFIVPIVKDVGDLQALLTPQPPQTFQGVGETLDIPDFGISIDYPAGWIAETVDSGAVISEKEIDHPPHFSDREALEGYQISIVYIPKEVFTQTFGLPEDLTLSDLHDFNVSSLEWEDPEVTDTELFGVAAKRVRVEGQLWWEVSFSGVRNDEVFRLVFTAPSEEALDAFLPSIERILESIRLTGE